MLFSVALVFLVGIAFGYFVNKLRLPSLLGMLAAGILLGPHGLNLIDERILNVSPELIEATLVVILLRAGLELNIVDLRKVGRTAILLCFLPAIFECLGFILFAPMLLGVSRLDAAIIGAVMGAVSPAIVVDKMAKCINEGYGIEKRIPHMLIAGSSADDVFVIVLFTSLLNIASGSGASVMDFMQIPISIVMGILVGILVGWMLIQLYRVMRISDSTFVVIILCVAFLLCALEETMKGKIITVSGLLAVMVLGMTILNQNEGLGERLNMRFSNLWVSAEILLFALVGAVVDMKLVVSAGISVVIMLFIGLIFRSFGVLFSCIGTNLDGKERLFMVIAQIPKANVQAAIGGIPLSMGMACGNIVLIVSIISIIVTAPLGALLIDHFYRKLLTKHVPAV